MKNFELFVHNDSVSSRFRIRQIRIRHVTYFDLMWPARRAESVVRLQGEKVSSHVISSSIICPALACSPAPVYIQPGTRINGSTVENVSVRRKSAKTRERKSTRIIRRKCTNTPRAILSVWSELSYYLDLINSYALIVGFDTYNTVFNNIPDLTYRARIGIDSASICSLPGQCCRNCQPGLEWLPGLLKG